MADTKSSIILIGADTPSGRPDADWGNFVWIDTVHRQIKTFVGHEWVMVADLADVTTTEGYSGEIKHGNDVFVFEKGLLIKYG